MKTTYVSMVSYGFGDCSESHVLYAGDDYAAAKKVLVEFNFPDPNQNWGWIDPWQEGKVGKREYIRE